MVIPYLKVVKSGMQEGKSKQSKVVSRKRNNISFSTFYADNPRYCFQCTLFKSFSRSFLFIHTDSQHDFPLSSLNYVSAFTLTIANDMKSGPISDHWELQSDSSKSKTMEGYFCANYVQIMVSIDNERRFDHVKTPQICKHIKCKLIHRFLYSSRQ